MTPLGSFWKRFVDLLPKPTKVVGAVSTVDGDGRYTLQLLGGAAIRARGISGFTVGDQVFVTNGVIEAKAPTLASEIIEV